MNDFYNEAKTRFVQHRNKKLEDFNAFNNNSDLKLKFKLILFLLDLYWNLSSLYIVKLWKNYSESVKNIQDLGLDKEIQSILSELRNDPLDSKFDESIEATLINTINSVNSTINSQLEMTLSIIALKLEIIDKVSSFDHVNNSKELINDLKSYIYSKIPFVGDLIELNKMTKKAADFRKNKIKIMNETSDFVEFYILALYNTCIYTFSNIHEIENEKLNDSKNIEHSKERLKKYFLTNFENYDPNQISI
jgi:hypothetical protein